jgi:hypothetical protein
MKKASKSAKPATKKAPTLSAREKAPSLESVYGDLEQILLHHVPPFKRGSFTVRDKKSLQLVTPKPVAVPGAYGGKPVDLQVAAVILQKGYVGFYLMGIYSNVEARKKISPVLLKLLKGKSCFQVKALDEGLKKDVEAALQVATNVYRERGWV